ncbi:MAG TPA: class I SAM-dependent methyltransferase [Gammaproteobacteria bacterium]|nr:class I SAM-dependent methyltransferase [Gammaproteobacteria bacterium]
MKVRESGMPDEGTWERFFEPDRVLVALRFPDGNPDVVDFGSGFGTFTVAAARRTRGMVYALDIDRAMVDATNARAAALGLHNVRAIERDFVVLGTGLPDGSVDYAMLFNILHGEEPETLLAETRRVLRPTGTLAAIHWNHDARTPRGPPLAIRPTPAQCSGWVREAGFEVTAALDLPPYHYGVVAAPRSRLRA